MNFLHCRILSQRYFFLQKQLSLFLESMPQLPHTQHHVLVLDMCICMSRWNRVALVTVVVKTSRCLAGLKYSLASQRRILPEADPYDILRPVPVADHAHKLLRSKERQESAVSKSRKS